MFTLVSPLFNNNNSVAKHEAKLAAQDMDATMADIAQASITPILEKICAAQQTSLAARVEQTSAALKDAAALGNLALLVIDVQKQFCDPAGIRGNGWTDRVSTEIARIVPQFRAAGVPVYPVYFDTKNLPLADIDFYKFRPEAGDTPIAKSWESAFEGSNIKQILETNGHRNLLVCGFNLGSCIRKTVADAHQKGFRVSILSDLTGNDNKCYLDALSLEEDYRTLLGRGAQVIDSGTALKTIESCRPA